MNIYFRNIIRIIQKHKYMWIGIVVGLMCILLILQPTVMEGLTGMEIGQYDYLTPIPAGNTINDNIFQAFVPIANKKVCPTGGGRSCIRIEATASSKAAFEKYATEEEMMYYIKNGKWPWSSSLIQMETEAMMPVKLPPNKTLSDMQKDIKKDIDLAQLSVPSRKALGLIQYQPNFAKVKDSLPYQMYMGTADKNKNPGVLDASMKANYQSLVNLCKKVV